MRWLVRYPILPGHPCCLLTVAVYVQLEDYKWQSDTLQRLGLLWHLLGDNVKATTYKQQGRQKTELMFQWDGGMGMTV